MVFGILLSRAWAAVKAKDPERLEKRLQLLDDADRAKLLYRVINSGKQEYAEILLEYDMPLEKKYGDELPLQRALDLGHFRIATLLIAKGADVNKPDQKGCILLHRMVRFIKEHEAIVRLAIEKGDTKQQCEYGLTALHHAAQSGQETNCRLLIELGSSVDTLDNYGRTPFLYAAQTIGTANVVRELASLNANIQQTDGKGNTALHLAAEAGCDEVIPALGEVGVPVNAINNEGRTALHVAVESKRYNAVRELALLDADPEIKDKNGVTALQLAMLRNQHDTVVLLKRMRETKTGTPLSPAPKQTDHVVPIFSSIGRGLAGKTTSSSSESSLEASEDRQRRESKIWLERIQRSPVTVEQVSEFAKLERIKIAVLDTGYDPESDFFRNRARKRLIEFEDWVDEGSTSARDEDGHGTHVLSLVMKVAPAAKLFVCRIARGREAQDLRDASSNIAKAITRAAIDWQANIISLSFGYPEEVLVNGVGLISNAISQALAERNQRLLIFAAASNGGPSEREMFPANSPSVMSIRGSDAKGWLQTFNALPNPDGIKCFMTLGQSVPGAPLSRENEKGEVYKSGTSSATPIAAGIAAIILGYAMVHEQELKVRLGDDKHRLPKLWQISGMRAMFAALSNESFHRCLSLDPFKFTDESHQKRLHLITEAVWKAI